VAQTDTNGIANGFGRDAEIDGDSSRFKRQGKVYIDSKIRSKAKEGIRG